MFVRLNRNSRGMAYLQIVRSYRDNGKVKQEILFTLGRLDVLQKSGQIDGLLKALGRFATRQQLIDLSQDVSIEDVYYLGSAHVVRRMLERTGLWKTLETVAHQRRRMQLPWLPLVFGMILSRFVEPCSKRRLHREWWKKLYPELVALPEDKQALELHWFYRAMDVLYRHREDVERALFDRRGERDLFNQTIDVVFYDTTTLYFESTRKDLGQLRQKGFSKEHRSDCVQVVLGLLVDRDGIPVGYELFPGNTYDGKSVPRILDKLRNKYQLGRIIFVGDRGMVSAENIKEIRAANLEFILGARLWKMAAGEVAGFFGAPGQAWRFQRVQLPPQKEDSHLTANRVLAPRRQRRGSSVDRGRVGHNASEAIEPRDTITRRPTGSKTWKAIVGGRNGEAAGDSGGV